MTTLSDLYFNKVDYKFTKVQTEEGQIVFVTSVSNNEVVYHMPLEIYNEWYECFKQAYKTDGLNEKIKELTEKLRLINSTNDEFKRENKNLIKKLGEEKKAKSENMDLLTEKLAECRRISDNHRRARDYHKEQNAKVKQLNQDNLLKLNNANQDYLKLQKEYYYWRSVTFAITVFALAMTVLFFHCLRK